MPNKTPYILLAASAVTLIAVSISGPAFSRSFTSAPGPRGNTVTATGSAHPVRGGVTGSGSVTTSGGRSVTGEGTVTKNANGTYTGTGSATTGQGKTVDVTGTGTKSSGTVTVSGGNGSKTVSY